MILINDLGINISLKYIGKDITECKDFISFMASIQAVKKPKNSEWIVPKSYLEEVQSNFEYELQTNPWDNIGADLKSAPYPYQKEALPDQLLCHLHVYAYAYQLFSYINTLPYILYIIIYNFAFVR